eukprot:TRINITY_DN8548_c0_g1_i1.p1 TRINITY_DN8548_c0_g1~~TRINITY_DN8548_c0_g1_i1.p1  ORF type:complete len:545 (+),score=130.31 TRINITY_DN8548_c0_g1_i1:37-1635(+)
MAESSGWFKHAIVSLFLGLYWVLDWLQYYRADPVRVRANPYLKGNFAPVQNTLHVSSLKVKRGKIPADLRGEFVRNGANPVHVPRGGYHWFDGDGMLHGVRLQKDNVTYINRYVNTLRYMVHDVVTVRLGELWGILGLCKIALSLLHGFLFYGKVKPSGSANTSLFYHAGRMFALVESDGPTWVKILKDGEMETMGIYDYKGKLSHNFTAHPKLDTKTGEVMAYGYRVDNAPYLFYSLIDKNGDLVRTIPITIPEATMMHDMAITENYSIFVDFSLAMRKLDFVKQGRIPFLFDPNRKTRIGVIPRHAKSEASIRWYEASPGFAFHIANAWETSPGSDDNEIVMQACRMEEFNVDEFGGGGTEPYVFNNAQNKYAPILWEWRIHLKDGRVTERPLADSAFLEFPKVHPDLVGRPSQYAYLSAARDTDLADTLFDGIMKVDLFTGKVVKRMSFGGGNGGEAVFVPRKGAKDEDDGYLMTFVYWPETDTSEFWIVDARTLSNEPVAVVELPQRVPYGFHGIWMSEEEINAQKES